MRLEGLLLIVSLNQVFGHVHDLRGVMGDVIVSQRLKHLGREVRRASIQPLNGIEEIRSVVG